MQQYKLIRAPSLDDLEVRVNYFLSQYMNYNWRIHGDVQMYSYSEFVQTVTNEVETL